MREKLALFRFFRNAKRKKTLLGADIAVCIGEARFAWLKSARV